MKEIETVSECCKHEQCIYRRRIGYQNTEVCAYSLIAGRARNCSISNCDKYVEGKKKKPVIKNGILEWEYELYAKDKVSDVSAGRSAEHERNGASERIPSAKVGQKPCEESDEVSQVSD